MIPISTPTIGRGEFEAVQRVLESGHLVSGAEVEAFESEFAAYIGTSHAVAVSSGTSALLLSLLGMGIGAGDEVIVPAFTFAATANAVRLAGATPVFVDIDYDTYCIDLDAIGPALTSRTAAVIVVHLYGRPASICEIASVCSAAGIGLVEDAAQAHGAKFRERMVGSFGDAGCFSFYATKNMTTGEGGMITTDDDSIADRVRLLRNQGMRQRYEHEVVGMNERMTEIEAAIGRCQLRLLNEWNDIRRANASHYAAILPTSITPPEVPPDVYHVYHQYTLRVPPRRSVIQALEAEGIGYGIYYPYPLHHLPPFQDASRLSLPIAEGAAKEVLSVPVGPHCGRAEVERIGRVLAKALGH